MMSIRSPGREGEHSNVKIKALSFVLMAVLLLCDCEPNEWGRGAADL